MTADERRPVPRAALRRMLGLALAVGALAGIGIIAFELAIQAARWMSHEWTAPGWSATPSLVVVFAPTVAGLLVGGTLHLRGLPEEPGHGVTEVIEAVSVGGKAFPAREMPLKAGAAAVSLGGGASLGPEDPAVEIGGGFGELIGQRLGLAADDRQALVAIGAAGGLSAAFGAPLAAIAFAVEVFTLRAFSRTVALVATAAAVAYGTVVLAGLVGPTVEPRFEVAVRPAAADLPALLLLGLAAGVASALHIRLCYATQARFQAWQRCPRWAKPAIGGFALGLTGLLLPQVLGIGYEALEVLLVGPLPGLALVGALLVGKVLATAVSFGSGFLGGFFAPSLFIGAALGALLGLLGQAAAPALGLTPTVLAAGGAVGVLAGCVRAPVTAVLVALAMTTDLAFSAPLLLAAVPAAWLSHRLHPHSLYTQGLSHPEADAPEAAGPHSDAAGGAEAAEGPD